MRPDRRQRRPAAVKLDTPSQRKFADAKHSLHVPALQSDDGNRSENPMSTERRRDLALAALASATLGLAGCGGGGSGATDPPPFDNTQRSLAAATTASSSTNACAPIRPFYWELGDASGRLASASVDSASSALHYVATTVMGIASASKWLYGAYVVERRGAAGLNADDVEFLTFRSGYTRFTTCLPGQTVDACVAYSTNGDYIAATDGKFLYGGGHMQMHASRLGLGPLDSAALAAELRSQLGSDIALSYSQPQLAGGVRTDADDYARFLRKLLSGALRMGAALGTNPVCTNPQTCSTALGTPVPASESWHYSIGHWVEDDPVVGDGAYSSAGAFGFYPWVDASKRYYGIVAREDAQASAAGVASVDCGRIIRKAWMTGVAQ